MAKRWILAAAMAASWAGAAAAGTIKIEPVETLGSIVEFRDGMAGARSSLARSDAALLVQRATHDEKDMPALMIAVENHSQAPFNLTTSSVIVTTQGGEAVAVLGHRAAGLAPGGPGVESLARLGIGVGEGGILAA